MNRAVCCPAKCHVEKRHWVGTETSCPYCPSNWEPWVAAATKCQPEHLLSRHRRSLSGPAAAIEHQLAHLYRSHRLQLFPHHRNPRASYPHPIFVWHPQAALPMPRPAKTTQASARPRCSKLAAAIFGECPECGNVVDELSVVAFRRLSVLPVLRTIDPNRMGASWRSLRNRFEHCEVVVFEGCCIRFAPRD